MKKQTADTEGFSKLERTKKFTKELLHWNRYDNHRPLPWKGEKNPYRIWLSEIILQQTRVEQGLKYYQKFIAAFPDVRSLAAASDEKVFKLWEGLGYYSRCRNLLQAARYIVQELNGVFPQTYEGILALKGVGAYTAAAIASFAYNQPYAVLDGNVFRVLSRIFDNETPVDSTAGKKSFSALAQALLPPGKAAEYNQAIMDFGATVCKPVPLCEACFYNRQCLAFRSGKQQLLPVKGKKVTLKKRWLNYFILQCGNEVLVRQRSEKDVWQGLHEFFLIETNKACRAKELQTIVVQQAGLSDFRLQDEWKQKQALSHQQIFFHLFHLRIAGKKSIKGYQWVHENQVHQLAFPRTLQAAVQRLFANNEEVNSNEKR